MEPSGVADVREPPVQRQSHRVVELGERPEKRGVEGIGDVEDEEAITVGLDREEVVSVDHEALGLRSRGVHSDRSRGPGIRDVDHADAEVLLRDVRVVPGDGERVHRLGGEEGERGHANGEQRIRDVDHLEATASGRQIRVVSFDDREARVPRRVDAAGVERLREKQVEIQDLDPGQVVSDVGVVPGDRDEGRLAGRVHLVDEERRARVADVHDLHPATVVRDVGVVTGDRDVPGETRRRQRGRKHGIRRVLDVDHVQARAHADVHEVSLDRHVPGEPGEAQPAGEERAMGVRDVDHPQGGRRVSDVRVVATQRDAQCSPGGHRASDDHGVVGVRHVEDQEPGGVVRDERVVPGDGDAVRLPRRVEAPVGNGRERVRDVHDLETEGGVGRHDVGEVAGHVDPVGPGSGDVTRDGDGMARITDVDHAQPVVDLRHVGIVAADVHPDGVADARGRAADVASVRVELETARGGVPVGRGVESVPVRRAGVVLDVALRGRRRRDEEQDECGKKPGRGLHFAPPFGERNAELPAVGSEVTRRGDSNSRSVSRSGSGGPRSAPLWPSGGSRPMAPHCPERRAIPR